MQKLVAFLGRFFFSAIFISSGINKILNWDATEQYLVNQMLEVLSQSYHMEWAKNLFDHVLPLAPTLLAIAVIAELAGGLLVLLGLHVRLGAFLLGLFLIPTTVLFHNFWDLEGSERAMQMIMFMKNIALFGGALTLMAWGKGRQSPRKEGG